MPKICGSKTKRNSLFDDMKVLQRLIAELAKSNPIIIRNSSNPSSRKNLDVRPTILRLYKVLLLTCVINCNAGHANATALFSSPGVSALGSESDDSGSSPGRGKALCP